MFLCYGIGLFFFERAEILLPFHGKEVLFFVVALFTARNKVPLYRFPSAHDRDKMVHGQISRFKLAFAIVAATGRALPLPPLRSAQFTGFGLLSFDVFVVDGNEIIGHGIKK